MNKTIEQWRPIKDFHKTEISNLGRVRSVRSTPYVRKLQVHENGYILVRLQQNRRDKLARVHVLVAEAFIGPNPGGLDVNHKDGVKSNNCVENLEYMTRSKNCKHGFRLGLSYTPFRERGENHCRSKVTDNDVRRILQRYKEGTPRSSLAKEYGLSYYTIWDMTKRRIWTHITD